MKAAEFARAYSNGLIATDIRVRLAELSPRDATLSRSKLYDWLERFSQDGIFALAPNTKTEAGQEPPSPKKRKTGSNGYGLIQISHRASRC
ncbi:MAG: hypothetical protein LBD79_03055 [Treponema sp.]|nr:hypothetical protein [Treponema sp.]